MNEYQALLEEETFKVGERDGRIRTALTILTDMLLELNALEIYYQKPVSKSIAPQEIHELRRKIDAIKELLQTSMNSTS